MSPLFSDWKASLDRIMMKFKKCKTHFRYLIKNSNNDIEVLCKKVDPDSHVPYQRINVGILGVVKNLKLDTKNYRPD